MTRRAPHTWSIAPPALALAVAALAATACGSVRPAAPPVEPPAAPPEWEQAAAVDAAISAASVSFVWWEEFDHPALDHAIRTALAGNQNLAAAAARLDSALAQARIAGADLEPSVGASLDGARRQQNFIGLPIPGAPGGVLSSTSTNLGVSLNVSWEADLWGRLRAVAGAGEALAATSSAELAGARLSLTGQVAKAWFAVVETSSQLDLARETLASRARTSSQIRRRYERGLRNALDLRLALSSQAAAEAAVASRERQLDAARRQLQVLLGRYPSHQLDPGIEADALPRLPPPPPAGLPGELLQRRPDLVAAERRLQAAGFEVRAARASLYPSLRLTGAGGTASNELEDLLDADFSVWSLAAGLLQPVFQGGRLRAGVDRAEARQSEAAHVYSQQILVAFAEVEQALAAASHLDAVRDALAEAATQAAAAQKLAEDRYLAGLNDYLTVLEAQRQAFLAKSQLLDVERQRLVNRVDLHLALGGSDRPSVQRASS